MAQLFLAAFRFACHLPAAPIIAPIIMAVNPVNPLNIVAYLGWLFGLKYSKAAWSKRFKAKAALWALAFYFATVTPIYFVLILIICHTI